MRLTYDLIMAAAQDAGERSARKANRQTWTQEDWNAACAEFNRLHSYLVQTPQPKQVRT